MTRQEQQEAIIHDITKKAIAIEQFIKSDAHTLIMDAIQEEINKLKNSYDCKTLQEIATLKGEYRGLTFLPNLIAGIRQSGEIANEQAIKIEKKKALESEDIDSTDL